MENITYELKYCERCGSLGLRQCKSPQSYCRPCGQLILNYSLPADARRGLLSKTKPVTIAPLILKAASETTVPAWGLS